MAEILYDLCVARKKGGYNPIGCGFGTITDARKDARKKCAETKDDIYIADASSVRGWHVLGIVRYIPRNDEYVWIHGQRAVSILKKDGTLGTKLM